MLLLPVALFMLGTAACENPKVDGIRIGILSDCEGFAAPFYDVTLAGAELPLLRRGGSLAGQGPSSGVNGVSVNGHPVKLVFGCAGDAVGSMIETRRLVEQEGVDVVIGPNVIPDTFGLIEYARRHTRTAFVIATMEHAAGLDFGPNIYRFTADSVQTAAGLGGYAFNDLGWRTAKTVAPPDLWQWGLSAGFVAEFCSLGGSVVDRVWLDVVPEEVPALLREVPLEGMDGFFVAADTESVAKFLERYAKRNPPLAEHVVSGAFTALPVLLDPSVVERLGDDLLGVVTATFVPLDASRPEWNAYVNEFRAAFPDLAETAVSAYHMLDIDYENAMEAVMRALEAVDGDLSDGGQSFRGALAEVHLDAPNGPIRLDGRRQAILPIYLSRVEKDGKGDLVYRTFMVVDDVDQTYGGALDLNTTPDRTLPTCRAGDPPPWATSA